MNSTILKTVHVAFKEVLDELVNRKNNFRTG